MREAFGCQTQENAMFVFVESSHMRVLKIKAKGTEAQPWICAHTFAVSVFSWRMGRD